MSVEYSAETLKIIDRIADVVHDSGYGLDHTDEMLVARRIVDEVFPLITVSCTPWDGK